MLERTQELTCAIREIHRAIRDAVLAECEKASMEDLSRVVAEEGGDAIFAIDRVSEAVLREQFGRLAERRSLVLVGEGLGESGKVTLPERTPDAEAELRVIIDPIDGTRGLMYQKRPGWVLTGVAPNRGEGTTLADIELAVQTEIPLLKQHLMDTLWAVRGEGAQGERCNRLTGARTPLRIVPSRASTIAQGFGNLARFFPGFRAELGALDDAIVERILGPVEPGKAQCFEDQYISSGGQLYEILMGHDRWIADLRPLLEKRLKDQGKALGLCAHPYDLCTELIAREAGAMVCTPEGEPLAAPLDVRTDVAWVAYANRALRDLIHPVLEGVLRERSMDLRGF